jgi:hypothetical protein
MTHIVTSDRSLIRRALHAMTYSALDELASEELEGMYPPNLAFIAAALQSMKNEMHQGTDLVTDNFNDTEIAELSRLLSEFLAVLTETGTPRAITSDSVELSRPELSRLFAERDELSRRGLAIASRLYEIDMRIQRSGESKFRRDRTLEACSGMPPKPEPRYKLYPTPLPFDKREIRDTHDGSKVVLVVPDDGTAIDIVDLLNRIAEEADK